MIGYLEGVLFDKKEDAILDNVQGVGYEVFLSKKAITTLKPVGENQSLYIYTHVTENSLTLYGFLNRIDKDLFKTLLNVSGIGPKVALQMQSGLSTEDLVSALAKEDLTMLTAINGIGKKTAQRLIVELKDKLTSFESIIIPHEMAQYQQPKTHHLYDEALSALLHLGYTRQTAERALNTINMSNKSNVEDVLKESLRNLSS